MDIIIWLTMGGLVGWIATRFVGPQTQEGVILNVLVGIIGAMIGGWLAIWWAAALQAEGSGC